MARMLLSVVMNMETPWTLKPWHIKVSFRKCGYIVAEDAITLPEVPIKGPDMSLQDKEFFVTLTVSDKFLCFNLCVFMCNRPGVQYRLKMSQTRVARVYQI